MGEYPSIIGFDKSVFAMEANSILADGIMEMGASAKNPREFLASYWKMHSKLEALFGNAPVSLVNEQRALVSRIVGGLIEDSGLSQNPAIREECQPDIVRVSIAILRAVGSDSSLNESVVRIDRIEDTAISVLKNGGFREFGARKLICDLADLHSKDIRGMLGEISKGGTIRFDQFLSFLEANGKGDVKSAAQKAREEIKSSVSILAKKVRPISAAVSNTNGKIVA